MKTLCYHILLVGFLGLFMQTNQAQDIPENRLIDWTSAGLLQSIDEPNLFLNVSDFGAWGDGIHDDTEAVLEALENTDQQAATIYFPPGAYLLTQNINFHSGLCLLGDGSDQSHLKFELSSDQEDCLVISGIANNEWKPIISGYQKYSTQLAVMDVSGIQPGDWIEIEQENGTWDTDPASWAQNVVGQLLQVSAVSGNEIYLSNEIRIDYNADLSPQWQKIEPLQNIKIENLSIERLDEPDCGGGKNLYLAYAVNVQISGMESRKSQGSHIYATRSSHAFIFGNYIHDAFLFDGTDTRGYGVTLNMHTGDCLIENNIFKNLRHAMMVKTGANGNVFSYNYSREPHRSEPIANYTGDISVHGHYPYANLFEENVVQNLFIDHYWGPGGPLNTFMRNRTELFGVMMTTNDGMETQSQNFIGNEIGGNFPYGLYIITGEDHFEYGNNDGGGCVPANTNNVTDESYFYGDSPWFLDVSFPTIGYPNELNENEIPAKERWLNGGSLTMEYLPQTVGLEEVSEENMSFEIVQNPVRETLLLRMNEQAEPFEYHIYSVLGHLIDSGHTNLLTSQASLDVSRLSPGTYVLHLKTSSQSETLVFVKSNSFH